MDASLFKYATTSRGLKYHYYFSPAQPSKATLLFCHGFPSRALDWRRIAPFFKDRGYGVLAVNQLGFHDTAQPTDAGAYVPSLLAKDFIDILDAEKLDRVIAVGHDWGSKMVSRLASHYPERFAAYAFLVVAFWPVLPPEDIQVSLENWKKLYGSELFGYWRFHSEPDSAELIQSHIDSFFSLWFPQDPAIWETRMAPTGAVRRSLLEDYVEPLPSYLSEEDKKAFVEFYQRNGFEATNCWYRVMTHNLSAIDDQQIPPERLIPPARAPIFWGAAKNDRICRPELGDVEFAKEVYRDHSITRKEYDADHWAILSRADEITRDLEAWIKDVVVSKAGL